MSSKSTADKARGHSPGLHNHQVDGEPWDGSGMTLAYPWTARQRRQKIRRLARKQARRLARNL